MIFRGRFRSRILILFVLVLLIFYYLDNLVTLFKDFNSKSSLDQSPSSHKSHYDKPQGKTVRYPLIRDPRTGSIQSLGLDSSRIIHDHFIVQKLARKPKKGYLTLTNSFKNTFNALDIIQEQSKMSKRQTPSRSRATYKAPASL